MPDELPDFYNITLERPRDDPDGYDVLFVDAAFAGSFASRMSHSCTPNCAAVIVSAGGRLTVAMYTTRPIAAGEELTFDYASVTESEKEFREAACLCGTRHCRGSYLYYAGSSAFMQVRECVVDCVVFVSLCLLLCSVCVRSVRVCACSLLPARAAMLCAAVWGLVPT